MKPDWKDAPDWANWLAMDQNGKWFWYEKKPLMYEDIWCNEAGDRIVFAGMMAVWQESLQERPDKVKYES